MAEFTQQNDTRPTRKWHLKETVGREGFDVRASTGDSTDARPHGQTFENLYTTPGTLRANEENPTLEGVTGVAVPDTNQATVDSKRLPVTIAEKKDM